MMVSIKEFCKIHNCALSPIYRKIKRYQIRLDGHIEKKDGVIMIDEYAQELLIPESEKTYLLKAENNELKDLNNELAAKTINNDYYELSSAYKELTEKAGKQKTELKKLEKENSELLEKCESTNIKIQEYENRINDLEQKVKELTIQLQEKNKKGIFKR